MIHEVRYTRANYDSPHLESGFVWLAPDCSIKQEACPHEKGSSNCHLSHVGVLCRTLRHTTQTRGVWGGSGVTFASGGLCAIREKYISSAHPPSVTSRIQANKGRCSCPFAYADRLSAAFLAAGGQGWHKPRNGLRDGRLCFGYMTLGRESRPPRMSGEDVRTPDT
jgi:hypothetical protein